MIGEPERARMGRAHLCGERVIEHLESIGVTWLADLAGRNPWDVMYEVNLEVGRGISRPPFAVAAIQNLIDAAEREAAPPALPAKTGG